MAGQDGFAGYAILELMGHRKLAGFVQEQEIAGAGFLRIDIPNRDGSIAATQFYPPHALYALTPTTEEIARAMAPRHQPAPVTRWELQLPEAAGWSVGSPDDGRDDEYRATAEGHEMDDLDEYDRQRDDDDDLDDLPL